MDVLHRNVCSMYGGPMTMTAELKAQALRMAASLEPASMTGEAAAQGVAELALAEKAVATARMFLAVRVAQTDAWQGQGYPPAADWLPPKARVTLPGAAPQPAASSPEARGMS